MLPGRNGVIWSENNGMNNNGAVMENRDELGSLSIFNDLLDEVDDWCVPNSIIQNHDLTFSLEPDDLLLNPLDSSASASPASSVFTNLTDSTHFNYIPNPRPNLSSLINILPNNSLAHGFDLTQIGGFMDNQTETPPNSVFLDRAPVDLTSFTDLNSIGVGSDLSLDPTRMGQFPESGSGLSGFPTMGENENGLFMNRSKQLRPLENLPPVGTQPTLFQKRALRKNLSGNGGSFGISEGAEENGQNKKRKMAMIGNGSRGNPMNDGNFDTFEFNYDSDDVAEFCNKFGENGNGGNTSNGNENGTVSGGGGARKGHKKGMPAKNLMAERRRRKKLNDRLYMLRSVVPKISKMDRASILGDAIDYLKELLQKINDISNELESITPGSSTTATPAVTPTSSFNPLTPTASALRNSTKDELCPSPIGQPARVEVRAKEGRGVNIHMFCNRRPGLLLSTMKALDNLGLDVQQAVISCFNGFTMDIFRAEQRKEQDVHPEQIKAALLESAGLLGLM